MGMSKSAPRSIEQLLRWVSLVGEDGAQALTGAAASFWVLCSPQAEPPWAQLAVSPGILNWDSISPRGEKMHS